MIAKPRKPGSAVDHEIKSMCLQDSKDPPRPEEEAPDRRFYVVAPSVNAVRRALFRAPGGARVIGRHDRDTIACQHTMDAHSLARHWPILISRLSKAGLRLTPRPESSDQSFRGDGLS